MNQNPNRPKHPFLHIFGPLFFYWLIQFAAEFIGIIIIVMFNTDRLLDSVAITGAAELSEEAVVQLYSNMLDLVSDYNVELMGFVAACTLIYTGILFWRDRKKEREQGVIIQQVEGLDKYAWLVLMGAGICVAANILSVMISLAYSNEASVSLSGTYGSTSFLIQILCVGILVPISEEMLFRGLMFRRCRDVNTFGMAALYATVIYCVMHTTLVQIIYALILGFLLCYVYEKFRSIKAAICLHVTANVVSLIMTETNSIRWICQSVTRMGVTVVISVFICGSVFLMIQRINQETESHDQPEPPNDTDAYYP